MLKSLKTKNFRKLEDNHFTFEDGMVVIRGSNEAGKSTLTEAIAYAMFGVKSCRGSLADVVTWGKPESSLSVEMVMSSEGVDYTITRSKAGAEINYEGGKVTGQVECSNFVETLFGVNNGNVGKLVSSSQGQIRGALEQGPKATMELIENLANFDLLDQIVETVQANLITGPTASAEAVVAAAELRHDLVVAGLIEPETDEWEEQAVKSEAAATKHAEDIEALKPTREAALEKFKKADEEATQRMVLLNANSLYEESIKAREESIEANKLVECPDEDSVRSAEVALESAINSSALLSEYVGMTKMMELYPEDFWEGSEESLDEEIDKTDALIKEHAKTIQECESEIRVLNAKKVTGSVCGFCNQDVSKFPEVLANNKAIDGKIAAEKLSIEILGKDLVDAKGTLDILKDIKICQKVYKGKGTKNVEEITLQVPYTLSWIGEVPKPVDANYIQSKRDILKKLIDDTAKFTAAQNKIVNDKEMIHEFNGKLAINNDKLSTLHLAEQRDALRGKFNTLEDELQGLITKEREARFEAQSIRASIVRELDLYEKAKQDVVDAAKDVEIAKATVADLTFNNALVKRLRAARPIIADKLWNVVLSAVSSYFSTMRGVKSAVTKGPGGFYVDNQSVEGLSGSTLDILGLAIRLALTRTFLPTAPFLILDEATAAMDERRSAETMAFLLAFGFKQTICVTHKDIEEGAANQLIQL